jgi:enediyne biosynthesis protein E4
LVKVKGKAPNTNAIGAIITARTGTVTQRRLVQSGTSYISQDDKRQHFGLGAATQLDSVDVKWPDGTSTRLENVKANQLLEVKQPGS